jgi:UDP-N-acetylglucosamine 1-carboxyvinyltransferase
VQGHLLDGGEVNLDYPSVGATENLMMAAVFAKGITVIRNAAKEPEIVDLQKFLNAMGARVKGAGTSTVIVRPVKELHGVEYRVLPDRIVTGTMMIAAAITKGELTLENTRPEHVAILTSKLKSAGCTVDTEDETIHIRANRRLVSIQSIETLPYPGFPTDMQAQLLALQTVSNGTSVVVENVFENRFKYAAELRKMGADITIKDRTAIIRGVKALHAAEVSAMDLRGGAALVLAALCAQGVTRVTDVYHIDRGYDALEEALNGLGADIVRI